MQVLDSKKQTALKNMSLDASLLDQLKDTDTPILHFYDWESSALTYGYFIRLDKYLDLKKLKENFFEAARRPTGGGIVFHTWDLAFSFLMPSRHQYFFENPLKNYHFVNQIVEKALISLLKRENLKTDTDTKRFSSYLLEAKAKNPLVFCMAQPSKYDLILQGKKAAGAAQRKKRNGYLHQGTIALIRPDKELLLELLLDRQMATSIVNQSFFLSDDRRNLADIRQEMKKLLLCQFKKML